MSLSPARNVDAISLIAAITMTTFAILCYFFSSSRMLAIILTPASADTKLHESGPMKL